MPRDVFFSFDYETDGWRAAKVRNIGKLNARNPVSDNDWETITRGGDAAIQRWIDSQLAGTDCCVVLVGQFTSSSRWVKYEIEEAWRRKKGVCGIRIHQLEDRYGRPSAPGSDPFNVNVSSANLYPIIRLHDPAGWDSKSVYASISANVEIWVEDAITQRARY